MSVAVPAILIVEDDPKLAEVISRFLELRKFSPVIATDGVQALAQVAAAPPDLILLDLLLPALDGLEVARRLKSSAASAHIPIIAVTAQASSTMRDAALAAGCIDYLVKPIQLRQLARRIEALLGQHPSPE